MSASTDSASRRNAGGTTPIFISIQDGAARCGVSVDFIRDRISDGALPAFRAGNRRGLIRVRIEDLDRLFRPIPTVRQAG